MVKVRKWSAWGEPVEVVVTECAALDPATALVGSLIDEAEAACDVQHGDAEIHAVNLAQGFPVHVSTRLSALLHSALWVARMTQGAVSPLAAEREGADGAHVPTVHPEPSYGDVRLDDETVLAPWGATLDITDTAKADTVDRAAVSVASRLECGVLVRMGEVVATAGHCPAGGWQVPVPGDGTVELVSGTAMASAHAGTPSIDELAGDWDRVSVVADDALWAYAASAAALHRGVGALQWLEQHELAARLVDRSGHVYLTEGWTHRPNAA